MTAVKRILVVDDDAEIRGLLTAILQRYGLVVDVAGDGGEATELLRQFQYAVVLVDLMMPGVDGFTLLERIAGSEVIAPPVVLVVTAAERASIQRLDTRRIHGIVRKPFDPDEIARLVVACAEIKSRGAFGAMAIATMLAGSPFLALFSRLS
jgi:CheY-like chemotaxis protein